MQTYCTRSTLLESSKKGAYLAHTLDQTALLEILASQQHAIWSHWMQHLFKVSVKNPNGSSTIPQHLVERWMRQMQTDYQNLSGQEKQSDREQAQKILDSLQ